MLASPTRWMAALGAALVAVSGCGGDDEIVTDGDLPPIDSGLPDAAPIDAENLCPGALTFEALAAGLETGDAEFEVAVTEVGNPGNTASSAPNGRVVICLPDDQDSELRSEKTDFLARVDAIPTDAAAIYIGAGQPYPLEVIGQTAAETLYTDLGAVFDDSDAHLVVSVLEYPAGTPLIGATVAIDKASAGPFARDADGGFSETNGDVIAGGGLVLFGNVPIAGGDAGITVTPPDGFRGSCTGPASLALAAGEMSGALFACQ